MGRWHFKKRERSDLPLTRRAGVVRLSLRRGIRRVKGEAADPIQGEFFDEAADSRGGCPKEGWTSP